jgi:RNA polymerase sigma-70 factor (ECF subfamily)
MAVPARAESDEYAELRAKLLRSVRRICTGWLADRADDIVQRAIIRIISLQEREGERELNASYLWKVAYTTTIDEIRRLRAQREDPLEPTEQTAESPAPSPEAHAVGRELGESIRDCMDALVRDRKVAVTLHLQGHSVPEAARLLGWNAKRVENLVYRALADLRDCLRSKGHEP